MNTLQEIFWVRITIIKKVMCYRFCNGLKNASLGEQSVLNSSAANTAQGTYYKLWWCNNNKQNFKKQQYASIRSKLHFSHLPLSIPCHFQLTKIQQGRQCGMSSSNIRWEAEPILYSLNTISNNISFYLKIQMLWPWLQRNSSRHKIKGD